MKKKIISIAALWLTLVLLVFVYTDRNEYTWSFAGGDVSHILLTALEAEENEAAYAADMAREQAEADVRRKRGEWGKENQYGGAPIASPAIDEVHGLNLMWGDYDVTVDLSAAEPVHIRTVSAGRQPFIRGGEALLQGSGAETFSFTLTDAAEHVAVACDLPDGAKIHSVTVKKQGTGVFSADLAAYAALFGAVMTALLVLSWDKSARGGERRRDAIAVIGIALFASMPLLWSGVYDGHDLLFHLNRIEGIAAGMRAGQFPVRIHASTLLGYGYASSQFYPELFMYIPAVMRNLGVSLAASVRVFEMMIHLAAAAAMYVSCRSLLGSREVSLGATALYVLCPYRLANIYVRATLAESVAMVFFPLLIWALYEVLVRDEKKWPLLAAAMTGIFLCHLLSTMFAAAMCALAALCCAKKLLAEPRRILAIVKAAAMTCLCSLVFLVPFLDYTMNTSISTSVAIDASAHVMRLGAYLVGFPGEVTELPYEATDFSYTVGMVPGLALMLGCAALIARVYAGGVAKEGEEKRNDLLALFMLGMGGLLLLGATEFFPWAWACSLRRPFSTLFMQIQYPWRLVGVAAPMLSIAAAWGLMREEKQRRGALWLIAALSIVFAGYAMQIFVQDVPLITQDSYCDTRIGQFEYTYQGTEKSALMPGEITAAKAGNYTVRDYQKQGTNLSFVLDAPEGCAYIETPLLYYPGYKASINGAEASRVKRGHNNMLRIYGAVEPENNLVRVWYEAPALWTAAAIASLAGACLLVWQCAHMGARPKRRRA